MLQKQVRKVCLRLFISPYYISYTKENKKVKKRKFMSLLLALVAAITMTSGCSDNASTPETTKSETAGGSSEYDELAQAIRELSNEVSELRNMISLAPGMLTGEKKEISDEDGKELNRLFEENEKIFFAAPPPTNITPVESRNWSRYTSVTAKEKLTYEEAAFYDRLDEVCRTFLNDPSHGIQQWKDDYTLKGAMYSDLGLTSDTVYNILWWFKYNNPQYYFLNYGVYTNDELFPTVYDFAAELADMGQTTNTMFDKLDSWIDECCDDEVTTWQKVCSINKIICDAVIYDPVVLNKEKKYTDEESDKAAGGKNQTIYSVLMTPETVCAGYARAFNAMANAVGVDSLVTLSDTHAWNAVKFDDDNFYFVDVCWNDTGNTTDWIGVGNKYVSLNDGSNCHVYQAEYTANWAPELPDSSYQPTEKDSGAAKVTLAKPELRITGSGTAGIKVEWNAVDKAENYYLTAKDENDFIIKTSTEDTFMYIPYTNGSNSLEVNVCAQCEDNGITVSSDWGEITCTEKGTGTKPAAPSNITNSLNDKNGFVLQWSTPNERSIIFAYRTDSSLRKMSYSYTQGERISFVDWNPDEENYFAVASVSEEGGKETFSDPVAFSYSKAGGLKMITGSIATVSDLPEAPKNFTANIPSSSNENGIGVECTWEAVNGADGYEFNISTKSDFSHISGSMIRKSDQTYANYRIISSVSDHLYFRVRTIKGSGSSALYSEWTTADIVTPDNTADTLQKPAAPTDIKGVLINGKMTFTWDEVQGATGYTLTFFKDKDHQNIWTSYNSTEPKFTIKSFSDGNNYYCGFQAVVSKNGKSAYSDYKYFDFVYHSQPDMPSNIITVQKGDNVTFKWDAVEGATGYTVTFFGSKYYNPDDVLAVYDTADPEITAKLTGGTTYHCGIQAVNSQNGSSVHSNYICFDFTPKASAASSEKPDMPSNIKTVQRGNDVTIKWDAVQGVTGYQVTFFKDDKYKEVLKTYDSNDPELTVTLTAGSTYYCGIRSVLSKNGSDTYSNYAAFPFSL